MTERDDYRTPRSGIQNRADHIVYETVSPFALNQRLNRLRFACYSFSSALISVLVMALAFILIQTQPLEDKVKSIIFIAGVISFSVFLLVYWCSLVVRRLHDTGRSGWLILIYLSPIVLMPLVVVMGSISLMFAVSLINPLFTLFLMGAYGNEGMNRYGTPNPPNGILVIVFGGIYWLLMVLGALANVAMVAFSLFRPELLAEIMLQVQPYIPAQ